MDIRKQVNKSHKHVRKQRCGVRRKGILWEYNWDGLFEERYSKSDKQYWKCWKRRELKKELKDRIQDLNN